MRVYVLVNILNMLMKRDNMLCYAEHFLLFFFAMSLINSIIQEHK